MRGWIAALWCVVLVGWAPSVLAQSAELKRAEALMREGKAAEAWRLLSALEPKYAGRPEFDLALAVAALESGRANLATLALERVVVSEPGNAAARLELARAFFALQDYERAEREFQFVLNSDPPPAIRTLVADYREKMRPPGALVASPGFSGYVEGALGHDTNANIATAQSSLFVPGLGTAVILDPAFRRDADKYTELAAGLEYLRPLTADLVLQAGADVQARFPGDLDMFDSLVVDAHVGLRQRLDQRHSVQYALRHNEFELDHAGYRRMQSASAEWSRAYGERARLGLSAQGHRLRYLQDDTRASSSDMLALGVNAAYVVKAASRTVALGGAFLAHDDATAGRADGDRRVYGASGGLQRRLAPHLDAYASVALLQSDYRQQNPDFGVTRRDRQLDLALGLSWQVAEGWSLRPQLVRTRNHSNIGLNDYARTEVELALRRAWD